MSRDAINEKRPSAMTGLFHGPPSRAGVKAQHAENAAHWENPFRNKNGRLNVHSASISYAANLINPDSRHIRVLAARPLRDPFP